VVFQCSPGLLHHTLLFQENVPLSEAKSLHQQFVIVLEGDAAESNAAIISRSFQLVSGIQWKIFLIYLVKFGVLMIMLVPAIMQVAAGGPDIDATGIQESDVNYISGFLQEFVLEWTTYIITALFFQLYMITRIEKKEIEIIRE